LHKLQNKNIFEEIISPVFWQLPFSLRKELHTFGILASFGSSREYVHFLSLVIYFSQVNYDLMKILDVFYKYFRTKYRN
jgi:hypothetical protein